MSTCRSDIVVGTARRLLHVRGKSDAGPAVLAAEVIRTRTWHAGPPTEPGWYWLALACRYHFVSPRPMYVERVGHPTPTLMAFDGDGKSWSLETVTRHCPIPEPEGGQ